MRTSGGLRYNDSLLLSMARELTKVSAARAASGDNTLVAAPGVGKRLAVQYLKGQRTSGNTGETVALIKEGAAGTQLDYCVFGSDVPGYVFKDAATELQLWVLPVNTALIANHDTTNSITYTLRYLVLESD
jgi:hypothetical protein